MRHRRRKDHSMGRKMYRSLVALAVACLVGFSSAAWAGGAANQAINDGVRFLNPGVEECLDGGSSVSGWVIQNVSEVAVVVCTFDGSTPQINGEKCGKLPGDGAISCDPVGGQILLPGEHRNMSGIPVQPCCVSDMAARLHTTEVAHGPGGPTPGFGSLPPMPQP